jgi:hypothetical protein
MTFRMPTPNWADVRLGENLLGFLQRTDPDQHWVVDDATGEPKAPSDPDLESPYIWTLRPAISSLEFASMVLSFFFSQAPAPTAPIWPGAGRVSVLESLTLTDGLVISANLRGLLFAITREAPGGGRWKFGDVSSWNNVGAVAFLDDHGEYERPITISVDTQVVVPLTMTMAAGAIIRLTSPFSGTVTPWVYSTD